MAQARPLPPRSNVELFSLPFSHPQNLQPPAKLKYRFVWPHSPLPLFCNVESVCPKRRQIKTRRRDPHQLCTLGEGGRRGLYLSFAGGGIARLCLGKWFSKAIWAPLFLEETPVPEGTLKTIMGDQCSVSITPGGWRIV